MVLLQPCSRAVLSTMACTLSLNDNKVSVLRALIVPFNTASLGMTLKASPAEIAVTEMTPDSSGDRVLDTIVYGIVEKIVAMNFDQAKNSPASSR